MQKDATFIIIKFTGKNSISSPPSEAMALWWPIAMVGAA